MVRVKKKRRIGHYSSVRGYKHLRAVTESNRSYFYGCLDGLFDESRVDYPQVRVSDEEYLSLPLEALPAGSSVGKSNKKREGEFLLKHINYYAHHLGLPLVHLNAKQKTADDMLVLAYFGDSAIRSESIVRVPDYSLSLLVSNSNMQFALSRLGFYEFLTVSEHLAGTFFEALFGLSVVSESSGVFYRLLEALLGSTEVIREGVSLSDLVMRSDGSPTALWSDSVVGFGSYAE